MGLNDPRELLTRIFLDVAAHIDGARLVADAAVSDPAFGEATHVLAVGKVALPMLRGLPASRGASRPPRQILAISPATGAEATVAAPDQVRVVAGDHPQPTARSVAAARAAEEFVRSVGGGAATTSGAAARLLVLLSGGASSLLCAPADGLGWEDKRDAVNAVARAGATIGELNTVRKHLSAIKGGRLALLTTAPIAVRALSDVIDDDPATIGSGPFSPDPTTFADAGAIVARLGVTLPAAARAHLERGAGGGVAETPKPGTRALDHVDYRVLAGPARVVEEARAAIARVDVSGLSEAGALYDADADADGADGDNADNGGTLREAAVEVLAAAICARAAREAAAGDAPARIFIGNGEPRVVLPPVNRGDPDPTGCGGRATHLALLVARGLAELPEAMRARVAFLAAGTDDRDGNTAVSGALRRRHHLVAGAGAGPRPRSRTAPIRQPAAAGRDRRHSARARDLQPARPASSPDQLNA